MSKLDNGELEARIKELEDIRGRRDTYDLSPSQYDFLKKLYKEKEIREVKAILADYAWDF